MPRLSLQQQMIKALLADDDETAKKLAAQIARKEKPKSPPKKRTKKVTKSPSTIGATATSVTTAKKAVKAADVVVDFSGDGEINVESFNKKNPKILFFDDGSCKQDSKIDKKLRKGAARTPRREPVTKTEVQCFVCNTWFKEFTHNLYSNADGQCIVMCPKCNAKGSHR